MYKYQHEKTMEVSAIAQLSSIILYGHRFFPYYTFNILGGIDAQGTMAFLNFIRCFKVEAPFTATMPLGLLSVKSIGLVDRGLP